MLCVYVYVVWSDSVQVGSNVTLMPLFNKDVLSCFVQ